jgi:hypothetical protein
VSKPLKVSDMEMPPADRSLSASTTGKRTHLRRWAISIALALLLHGAVAIAVLLTWQKSTTPLHPNGPLIVELPPPAAEPAAPLGEAGVEAPSAAKQIEANRAPGGPPKRTDEIPERKVASIGEERAEPTFASQSVAPTAPLENAEGENGVRTATGGGGGMRSAVPGGEAAGGPIDTRIAHFGPGSKKASRTLARKPIRIGRAAKDAGMQGHSRHLSAPAGVAINAIGARVQDRAAAAIARANSSQEEAKNAIGSNVANLAGSISANAANLAVTNAIGIAVRVRPSIPGPVIDEHGAGAIAFAGGAMPKAAINGTGMSRISLGAGAIGGPAKNVAGVLNGTSFRPRHP